MSPRMSNNLIMSYPAQNYADHRGDDRRTEDYQHTTHCQIVCAIYEHYGIHFIKYPVHSPLSFCVVLPKIYSGDNTT